MRGRVIAVVSLGLLSIFTGSSHCAQPKAKYIISSLAISPDGRLIAVGCGGLQERTAFDKVVLVDAAEEKVVGQFDCGESVSALTFSFDGKYIATGHAEKKAKVWLAEKKQLIVA